MRQLVKHGDPHFVLHLPGISKSTFQRATKDHNAIWDHHRIAARSVRERSSFVQPKKLVFTLIELPTLACGGLVLDDDVDVVKLSEDVGWKPANRALHEPLKSQPTRAIDGC